MPKFTANRETLIHKASEHAEFARMVAIGQFYITNDSLVDGNSSTPMNTQSQRILDIQDYKQILNVHVKIGPVTEFEVFKSAGALIIEVQVQSRQPTNVKLWVRTSRGVER